MKKDEFRITLQGAVAGKHDDLEKILELYAPLIDKYSHINGKLDEDLRQYLLMHIAFNIAKFMIE